MTYIAELPALGYYVEDLGQALGPQFEGLHRWVLPVDDDFEVGEPRADANAAWFDAWLHAVEGG